MKKQNWAFGIVICLGLSLLGQSFRMLRNEELAFSFVIQNLLYNFSFGLGCWYLHQTLLRQQQKIRSQYLSYLFSTISIIGIGATVFLYDYLFIVFFGEGMKLPEIFGDNKTINLFVRGVLVSGFTFFILYYLLLLYEKQQHSLEIEKLKQIQLVADISSLKEQLSPHFLFNTLNTLSSLTQEKSVKDFVSELANVYRYMLAYNKQNKATLEQELSFMESYLYILKTRLGDAINIEVKVDSDLIKHRIPPMTLQLLIENAVKHNIASLNSPLQIKVWTKSPDQLIVSNNFRPRNSTQYSSGIGLSNLMQRYQLLFGKDILIEKTSEIFIVKLPLCNI
ncbi:sensor histidine kinase [Olivibacter jilunii]|uniref:sensor histidine kinase n=1 Tax=Olivibacter jilunii TaxID=985016 RepID=UPI00103095D3|nr:histidine kinase [Olivibacter jilunii]